MAESAEEDLEIIESTDIPTDPNANSTLIESEAVDTNILNELSPKSSESHHNISALETIQYEQETLDLENESNINNQFIPINDPNNITQPTDTSIHNKTKSEPPSGFDMFSFFKVDHDDNNDNDNDDDGDVIDNNHNEQNQNDIEPQNKRAESMTGLNKLDYDQLNIENLRQFNAITSRDTDHEDDDDDNNNNNINNNNNDNNNNNNNNNNDDNDDDDEAKESQPMNNKNNNNNKSNLDDGNHSSLTSQHGSNHSKQDINVEEHNQNLQNQPDEQPVPPLIAPDDNTDNMSIEQKIDSIPTDSGIPMGIVTPSFVDPTHHSHNSIHKIPVGLHAVEQDVDDNMEYGDEQQQEQQEQEQQQQEEIENDDINNRMRSGTSVIRPDIDPYGDPVDNEKNIQNMEDILEAEEDINPDQSVGDIMNDDIVNDDDDEFNHDIEADDDDDDILKPKHFSRRSITDLVNAELDRELNDDPELLALHTIDDNNDNNNDGSVIDEYGSDDDDFKRQVGDEQDWMETAKKWMQKEKQLKEQIMDLQDDLDEADQRMRELQIETEKRISRMEEEKNEITEQYEFDIEELRSNHNVETEKLSNDNSTMARDLQFLKTEVSAQKQQITDYESEILEYGESLKNKEIEWKVHHENCPLLNEEISKSLEDKRSAEIMQLTLGSQQMDASLGKMITENKAMEDEINVLREEKQTHSILIEERNEEIDSLRSELEKLKASTNRNMGAIQELRGRYEDEQRRRIDLESSFSKLGNEYDMLLSYSNEQSAVLDMAEFAPTGIDPEQFENIKNKKSLFVNPRGGSRSIVQSMGGLSEFADHMRTLSNVSNALQSGAMVFAQDMKHDDNESITDHSIITETDDIESEAQSTDIGSIISNFTRYSFRRYHTHDASREFFFLLSLCVKLSLAQKYGVSPDIAPNNDNLWKQALSNNIKFHEYYDFLYNELTNLYQYKYKTQQGLISNIVITDVSKIRQLKEKNDKIKQLENNYNNNSYFYNKFENYTKGNQSIQNQLNTIKDRTYFSRNDDFFGGNIKITTRSNRKLNLQNHRSSQSSKYSSKSKRNRKSKLKNKKKIINKEPGNDHHDHPLNIDRKKRDSEKLSHPPSNNNKSPNRSPNRSLRSLNSSHSPHSSQNNNNNNNNKKRSFHLTQKSLEVLDPSKNPALNDDKD